MPDFLDHFDAPDLDTAVWVPHYLPQWSSRAESAAAYALAASELRLTIPPDQGLWCAAEHDPPRQLRAHLVLTAWRRCGVDGRNARRT